MAFITKEEIYEIKATNNLELMKEYCDEDKTNGFIHFEYAKMLIKNGMYSEAKEELTSLLTTRRECAAKLELGVIAILNNDYGLAREYFHYVEDYTEYQFEREKARFELAKLELECKNLEKSKLYFEKLIDSSQDQSAKLNLGRINYQLHNYEESKKYFITLLNTSYDYVVRHELGKVEYALGNIGEARYYFGTSIDQGNKCSIFELGKLEFEEYNYKEAEKYLEQLEYHNLYLPKIKYLLGEKEDSIEGFKKLFNTRDNFQSRLYLSMIYIKDRNYEEAFNVIKDTMSSYCTTDSGTKLKIALSLLKELNVFFYKEYPKYDEYTYSDRQVIMYDETNALSHIITNHTNHSSKNNFSEDIDLFNLFQSIKDKMTEETQTPILTFCDVYHIDYPSIGSEGESTLRIITLPGTKEIITMFPVFNKRDNLTEIDEEDNVDYILKTDILLKKLSTLYELSQTSDFDLGDVFSDSEKDMLIDMFDLKADKKRKLSK